ncbi:MAG: ribonuclease R [Desulfobulbaceae bacterium DB1]|nr:MAG: ribonuclease R [Desulfobulbaceae bacterium DB1]
MAPRRTAGKKSGFAQNRKSRQSRKNHPPRRYEPVREGRKTKVRDVMEDAVVGVLHSHGDRVDIKDIIAELAENRGQRKEIEALLEDLTVRQLVKKLGKKHYQLDSRHFVETTLSVHPRGFAFAAPVNASTSVSGAKDIFIPPRDLGTALHGDRVLVQVTGSRRDRFDGRVVTVLVRGAKQIVGVYSVRGAKGYVTPEDERYPFTITIEQEKAGGAENGDAVLVEISDFGSDGSPASGAVIEILGDPDSSLVQMKMVIRKFDLPDVFQEKSIAEAEGFPDRVEVTADRTDLRRICHVTIDGETARDFDDAVSVEKTKKGYRLYVSIADVSHYVRPGTPLDQDAWDRGTSVYFPTGVVPMLPERLSNNLCSLNPHVDRYAFTAILDFDRSGRRLAVRFAKSVICSQYRLTYTLVRQILVDKDPAVRARYKPLLTPLKWMAELGMELENQRIARGSMGFEIPEPFVEIGSDDTISSISVRERNLAHKIIEEFMLAANEAVAETFANRHFAAIYRIHQSPDPLKVAEFAEFMQSMGYEVGRDNFDSKWFNRLIAQTKGTSRQYLVSNLILRVMQQARYSPENIGHFGLAASFYTHFTSPIRRYPDLMVHRALKQLLWQDDKHSRLPVNLDEAGEFLSKRERVAVDAEREMLDRLKVRYMEKKVGESFAAIVSGITSFGLFVELTETMISGGVAIADLPADGYEFHEKRHMLVGMRSGKTFQMGDEVMVRLVSVDKRSRRINFVLEDRAEMPV